MIIVDELPFSGVHKQERDRSSGLHKNHYQHFVTLRVYCTVLMQI